MYIVILVYLVVTAFFEEGVAYFDPVYTTLMSSVEFYLTFSLCAVLFIMVIYIGKHYFDIGINWVFFSLVSLLFLIDVVAILSFPEWTVLTGVYHVTVSLRLRYITFWLAACMAFYVFFAIMPKSVRDSNDWNFYFWGAIFIAFSACIFSYIYEWKSYISFFTPDAPFFDFSAPVSFTNNRNTYATLLLIGLFSSTYLFFRTKKFYYPLLGIFFFANILITISKTAILVSLFFVVVAVSFECFSYIKKRTFLKIFVFCLFSAAFIFPFLLKPLGLLESNQFFSKVGYLLDSVIDTTSESYLNSVNSRSDTWSSITYMVFSNPTSFLFGLGDWNFSWFLGFSSSSSYSFIYSAHSGVFDVLGRLGIIGFLLYCSLLVLFVILLGNEFRHKRKEPIIVLVVWIGTLLHGIVEDTNFLNMQAKDMMLLFMCYMPLLTNWNLDRQKQNEPKWEYMYASSSRYKRIFAFNPQAIFRFSLFIISPVFSSIIGLTQFYSIWQGAVIFESVWFQAQISLLFLFSPFLLYSFLVCKQRKDKKTAFWIFIISFVWLGCSVFASPFCSNIVSFIVILITGLVTLTIGFMKIGKSDITKAAIPYGVFCLLTCVLILYNKMIVSLFMAPYETYQPYAAMCLVLFNSFISFFVLFIFQKNSDFSPLDCRWSTIENSYVFISYRECVKREIRLMKANQKKPILRYQK